MNDNQWSHERQQEMILEPQATVTGATATTTTGATSDRQILETPQHERQILEPQATNTGATSDRYWRHERQSQNWSHHEQQILEPPEP